MKFSTANIQKKIKQLKFFRKKTRDNAKTTRTRHTRRT